MLRQQVCGKLNGGKSEQRFNDLLSQLAASQPIIGLALGSRSASSFPTCSVS